MNDKQCSVSLTQIFQSTFEPFTNLDWEAFAGCEGVNPQISIIGIRKCIVIIDETEGITYVQVHDAESENSWGWEIPTQPEQFS